MKSDLYYKSGDLVKYKDQIVEITSRIENLGVNLSNGCIDIFIDHLDPIELTDQILLKLGFEYVDMRELGSSKSFYKLSRIDYNIRYSIDSRELSITSVHNNYRAHICNINYVHELQRLVEIIPTMQYYCRDCLLD